MRKIVIGFEVKSKWIVKYKDWNLAITENKDVYDMDSKDKLVTYWNNGSITYRLSKSTKRIGVKTINKHCVKREITIIEYIPF